MTYHELKSLMNDIYYDERNLGVRFGCDCGCGGNSFTYDSWEEMCNASDEAKRTLKGMGIIFEEDG